MSVNDLIGAGMRQQTMEQPGPMRYLTAPGKLPTLQQCWRVATVDISTGQALSMKDEWRDVPMINETETGK